MPEWNTSPFLNEGSPKEPGLYVVGAHQGYFFRYFDGEQFGKRSDTPWAVELKASAGATAKLKVRGWLPCIAVKAPTRQEIKAGAPADWRNEKPREPGVYRTLSRLAEGTRDITMYRVWSGSIWGVSRGSPLAAYLAFLEKPTPHTNTYRIAYQELDAVEMRTLAAIALPVAIESLDSLVRGNLPSAQSRYGVALEFIRRNPGACAAEVGQHLGEVFGSNEYFAQTMHHLHKRHLLHRELSMKSGPTFRYYAAGPVLTGVRAKTFDGVLISPHTDGRISISGPDGKYILSPQDQAMLRAQWPQRAGRVGA